MNSICEFVGYIMRRILATDKNTSAHQLELRWRPLHNLQSLLLFGPVVRQKLRYSIETKRQCNSCFRITLPSCHSHIGCCTVSTKLTAFNAPTVLHSYQLPGRCYLSAHFSVAATDSLLVCSDQNTVCPEPASGCPYQSGTTGF